MMQGSGTRVVWAVVGILVLQFLTVPFLGDIDKAGKLFVFCILTLAFAIAFFRSVNKLKISAVWGGFVLLWAIFFVSAGQAFRPGWAYIQVAILGVYLLFLLMMTHWSAVVPLLRQKVIDAILLFGLIGAVLGLYEYVNSLLFGSTKAMLIPYLLPPNESLQVAGPYGQPNLFALFLTLVLLAFFHQYLHPLTSVSPTRFHALRFVPFFLVALAFFSTGSRAGLLSLSFVIGFLAWLAVSGRYLAGERQARIELFRLIFFLAAAMVAVRGMNWLWAPGLDLGRRLGDVGISTDARFVFWTSAVLIFLDHPWLGVGLDGFRFFQNDFGPSAREALGFVSYQAMGNTNWAHNELLQILCEGGIFAFVLAFVLIALLIRQIWVNFVRKDRAIQPIFLYGHLFLLPFIVQSMFEWPFRSPPLLVLFFAFLGILLSQYPLKPIFLSTGRRRVVLLVLFLGLGLTSIFFYKEIALGKFMHELTTITPIERTFPDFESLVSDPYSGHRVLVFALPIYAHEALSREDNYLVEAILPYYERLCETEGVRWHWYNLALIYSRLEMEAEAKVAVQRAIDLMPSEDLYWDLLHYLNVLQASRASGRPLESFYPRDKNFDLTTLELRND